MLNPILFYIGDIPIIESDDMDSLLEYLKNSDIKEAIINDLKDHALKSYENQNISTLSKYSDYFSDSEGYVYMSDNYMTYELCFLKGRIVKAYKFNKGINFINPPKVIYDVISPIKIKFKENE